MKKRTALPELDLDTVDTKTFMQALGIPMLVPGDLHYQKHLQSVFADNGFQVRSVEKISGQPVWQVRIVRPKAYDTRFTGKILLLLKGQGIPITQDSVTATADRNTVTVNFIWRKGRKGMLLTQNTRQA